MATVLKYCRHTFATECKNTGHRNGLVLGVYGNECSFELSEEARNFDDRLSGALSKLLAASSMPVGDARVFNNLDTDFMSIALANVGSKDVGYDYNEQMDMGKENIRRAIGKAVVLLQDDQQCAKIFADGLNSPETVAEAATLAAWKFEALKSPANQGTHSTIEPYNEGDSKLFIQGAIFADAQNLSRRLTEIPANTLTPTYFAKETIQALGPCGITVDVHDRDWLESNEMHGILQASKGSCETPLFAVIGYCGADKNQKPLAFVGHATTYDTGSVCVRSCDDMANKKRHVTSGATLVGLMKGIAQLCLPVNVYAYIPLFESATSGNSIKASDTFKALNGKFVSVDNTKCISRLAVADALTYACRTNPEAVIHLNALSDATHKVFGELAAPLFTNKLDTWKLLSLAGAITGDRAWMLPSYERKVKMITEEIADVAVLGEGGMDTDDLGKSAAYAAQFLVDPTMEFSHIDIGGVYRNSDEVTYPYLRTAFATGRFTRTLMQMVYLRVCPQETPMVSSQSKKVK
ncbi:cytosol aminopeptidase-like [Adelges cooleyi]|uniref:cytosol aminopeptidase-like n=1 Tax=Adelges cooleyi TaxID=133065 RepID=UPI00218021C9|nr:cytosol aminopeptidase-like [Adelges cooleyi]